MIKKLLFLLIACSAPSLFAQNESNIWYFGNLAGLDFNTGIPVALSDGQVNTYEGSATICDPSGQLLFYTDGITVWNKNHQVMLNGMGLFGNPSSSQAAVIVPKPGSSSLYYIFTSEEFGNPHGFRYSEVDITLDGGLGGVTAVKNVLLSTPTCEKITAVKKSDNTGYWVVTHQFATNNFLAFSVTSAGVDLTPVVTSIGITPTTIIHTAGYLKASPDGTKMVSCSFSKNLELYDFDALTGQLSNLQILNTKPVNYGAEFSPSGNVLYITTGTGGYIQQFYQYNLQASNINASAVLLGVTTLQYGALQLGRDSKIYLSIANKSYLGVIHQPENVGPTCNFEEDGAFLGPGIAVFGLPQFIQSYFDTYVGTERACLGTPTLFSITGNQNITSASWDFGDGSTSTLLNPSHLYANAGHYDVTVTAQSTSGTVVQVSKAIVSETPIANLISNKVVCGYVQVPYNLAQNNVEIKGSQNNPLYRVAYFTSQANALAHTNILPNLYNLPIGVTTLFAKIYNNDNVTCFAITSFTISVFNTVEAQQPTDYIICETSYDGIATFNLESKNGEILGPLNSNQFTITYYKEYIDALSGIDSLPALYTNTIAQEIIYAKLENVGDGSCTAIVFFTIAVVEQPDTPLVTDMIHCDDGLNVGTSSFDLSEKNAVILDGLTPNLYDVHYYLSASDAATGINPQTAPVENTTNPQTVHYVLQTLGVSGCKTFGTFDLVVLPPLPSVQPLALHLCDDSSNDGKAVFDFDTQNNFLLDNQPDGAFLVTYHLDSASALMGVDSITTYTNTSNPQTIHARISSSVLASCFVVRTFTIQVDKMPFATPPNALELCSETDQIFATTDLSLLNPEILNGQSPNLFTVSYYSDSVAAQQGTSSLATDFNALVSQQTIYVRVTNNTNLTCFAVTDFQILVHPKPVLIMKTLYSLCENNSILITAPAGFDSYSWSTGQTTPAITVVAGGAITLTVGTSYGSVSCTASTTLTVVPSSVAVIREIVTSDWTDYQNSISVVVDGLGVYEYSIDGVHYQSSPDFNGLEVGEYTIYVRDVNGCGIVKEAIFLLNYPKYFTPNGDGYNDLWHVKFSAYEPELRVLIFDRFGKFLKVLDGQSAGWDGTYNGYPLPSTDYWFVVERKNGKEFRGHFSLKR